MHSPEICVATTVVNFAVKQKGLEDQLLGIVVQEEQSQLEEDKSKLVSLSWHVPPMRLPCAAWRNEPNTRNARNQRCGHNVRGWNFWFGAKHTVLGPLRDREALSRHAFHVLDCFATR